MSHTVTVSCAAMPIPPLEFFEIAGVETLSAIYSYTIRLKTPGDPGIPRQVAANADYKQMIGKEFTVAIELTDLSKREISGLVTSARILESNDQQSIYEIVIEPWLVLATRTSDYKRFQEKTVVQIVDEVLADYNFPVEKIISGSYPSLDYQVQYGETDFNFIQRLMQEWGIYWFFKHEGGSHKLVLIDDMAAHMPSPSADYQTVIYNADGKIDEEHLSVFHAEENHRSGKLVVNDFDFKKPLADLKVVDPKPRNTGFPDQELYEWPGDYTDPGIGKQLALVRMHAEGVAGSIADASGNVRGLPCGCTFTLAQNPTEKTNQQYLIVTSSISLRDVGKTSGQSTYHCHAEFSLLPTKKVYRSLRTVLKPRTRGPQTAIVVGPPGEEIYTDKYGRVKVQFHWDRYGKKDQDSSRWIRVSYPWAGSNFGGIQIPRIGQEVIVDFENGDPDRPIVVGKVYNALNMPPWGLPDSATQSGLLSRSSRGGGPDNANALRFEDKKGEEEVWLHAEKDLRTEVEHNELHTVDVDRSKTVGGNETIHIVGDRTHTVDKSEIITVALDQNIKIGKNLVISAGKRITWQCGKSSIIMDESGNIYIQGVQVTVIGSTRVDLNPDGGGFAMQEGVSGMTSPEGGVGGALGALAASGSASASSLTDGFGPEVNALIAESPILQRDLEQLEKDGWQIVHGSAGNGSTTNRDLRIIKIDSNLRSDPAKTVRTIAHEIGHAQYPYKENSSSKEAYVNARLADEGAATMKNIEVQREIIANSGNDIGIVGKAVNYGAYNAAYDQYIKDKNADNAYNAIGRVFSTGEHTSNTKQTYGDYYGGGYDAKYGTVK